jgi:hypothetical protein
MSGIVACRTAPGATKSMAVGPPYDRYPFTGIEFVASSDGHLTPEWVLTSPATMRSGDVGGVPVTTVSFRHADGTEYPQTINGEPECR